MSCVDFIKIYLYIIKSKSTLKVDQKWIKKWKLKLFL